MELLEGESVHARVERAGGRLPLPEVLALADELLDVLGAAHGHGIVHRDIKPENLFLTRTGQVKVLDFGIARLLDGSGATSTGTVLGTPGFMPPEQASGRVRDIGPAADLWAAAASRLRAAGRREPARGPHAGRAARHGRHAAGEAARDRLRGGPGGGRACGSSTTRPRRFDARERPGPPPPRLQAALRDAARGIAPSRSPAPATSVPTLVDEERPEPARER